MLNWGVCPHGRGLWQLGRAQGSAAGGGWTPGWAEREAAGSLGCQQDFVPAAALVFSGVADCGRWRRQEGAYGLRDTVGAAVLRQQPEPKCCLATACSAAWGAWSVHCGVSAGSCSARPCWDGAGLLQTGGPWRLAAFGEGRRSAAGAWSLAGLGGHGRGTGGHASVPEGQEGTGAEAGMLAGRLQGLLGSTLYIFINGLCPQSSRCC